MLRIWNQFSLTSTVFAPKGEKGFVTPLKYFCDYYRILCFTNLTSNIFKLFKADHDDRAVPAHSFKFVSQLQYSLGKKLPNTPFMLRIESNAGHLNGMTTTKIVSIYVLVWNASRIFFPQNKYYLYHMHRSMQWLTLYRFVWMLLN